MGRQCDRRALEVKALPVAPKSRLHRSKLVFNSATPPRGLEHLLYARARLNGNAFKQNNPISGRNGNVITHLNAAIQDIVDGVVEW